MQRKHLADMIISASDDDDNFAEIEVITTKQSLRDRATELAFSTGIQAVLDTIEVTIDRISSELEAADTKYAKEYVHITADKIIVSMECATVTDDVIDRAMLRLFDIDTFTEGTFVVYDK